MRALHLVKKARLDNLYLETSGCVNPMLLCRAIQEIGSDRVIFGSDSPFFHPKVCQFAVQLAIRDLVNRSEIEERLFERNFIEVLSL